MACEVAQMLERDRELVGGLAGGLLSSKHGVDVDVDVVDRVGIGPGELVQRDRIATG